MTVHGLGRTKAILALFTIAFLSIGVLVAWLAPVVSMQAASVTRELPQYTLKARDRLVDLIFRYDRTFGSPGGKREKTSTPTTGFVNWLLASPTPAALAETVSGDFASAGDGRRRRCGCGESFRFSTGQGNDRARPHARSPRRIASAFRNGSKSNCQTWSGNCLI